MYNHESQVIDAVSKVMDITTLRHRVLADNLANLNTPGFVRSDVNFQQQLTQAIDSGDSAQINAVQPLVENDEHTPMSPDGNNVSMQKEMAYMADNELLYNFAARVVNRKFAGLKKAISGN